MRKTIPFSTVKKAVEKTCSTMENVTISRVTQTLLPDVTDESGYSVNGLNQLGKITKFPADFVSEIGATNPELANAVLRDRVQNYFDNDGNPFVARKFYDRVCGVVTEKYCYFDDNEVVEIIDNSMLKDMPVLPESLSITPERLHFRMLDEESRFYIGNDESPCFFAYFIDNSMVGMSSFRVRCGIYRQVCTNGLIIPMQAFSLCRQIHRGRKDIYSEFEASLVALADNKKKMQELIMADGMEKSVLEELVDEAKKEYLEKKLNLSKKESEKVLMLYTTTYHGGTKWSMANAITEFARDVKDINRRVFLEARAFDLAFGKAV